MIPISVVTLGGPGLGKSTFASTVCKLVKPEKVLLIVAKPGEEKSWGYMEHGLNDRAELYYDLGWNPTLGEFKAGAYIQLLKRLRGLLDDTEFEAVIIDPGTDVVNLLEHHILAPSKVGSPGELSDTQVFYRQLRDKAQEFVLTAHLLSTPLAKKPKFVIIPWHTQPPKEGVFEKIAPGVRDKKKSPDERGAGIEYEGNVLPMLEGAYRRKLMGDVDVVVVCHIETVKNRKTNPPTEEARYTVRVVPNNDEHTKVRIAPSLAVSSIPNDMAELVKLVEGQSWKPVK
jgi:hypothetical protein